MSLKSDLKPYFAASIREKGEQYFFGGRIQITSGNDFKVEGKALGTSVYKVILEVVDDEIEGYCECPDYAETGVCKHVWGMVLKAEEKGHLQRKQSSFIPTVSSFDDAMQWFDSRRTRKKPVAPPKPAPTPKWKQLLIDVDATAKITDPPAEVWRDGREIYYVIDSESFNWANAFSVSIQMRDRMQSGVWGKLKDHNITRSQVSVIPNSNDRELLGLLFGKMDFSYGIPSERVPVVVRMPPAMVDVLMPRVCASGKCLLRHDKHQALEYMPVLAWDELPPFRLELHMEEVGDEYLLAGRFRRGEEIVELNEPAAMYESGYFVAADKISRFYTEGALAWLAVLRREKGVTVAKADGAAFRAELLKGKSVPATNWPKELAYQEVSAKPKPSIHFSPVDGGYRQSPTPKLEGALSFDYGHAVYPWGAGGSGEFIEAKNLFLRRDISAEAEAAARLDSLGLKKESSYYGNRGTKWGILSKRLPGVVRELLAEGWCVAAEGKTFKQAASFKAELTSGVDWFELRGTVDFGEGSLNLPQLIKALEKGEKLVALTDGSYGMLPDDFLSKYGMLLQLGKSTGDHIQFKKSQTGLLDVFLAEREGEIKIDELFQQAREQIRSFSGIVPLEQPKGFQGELRGYQCEGLGWMSFLEKAGWGGCLADDMGVGKTAQVLAMLEGRRNLNKGPSLAVLPRTLIYNWIREAAKFTPKLKVLDNSGGDRARDSAALREYDLVLTTYGTMRRDVLHFKDFVFDYVILDEAQAIKNATSESAKAARLLKANHRLALSGTPIENHLGELWSLFEFLNPGMMGGMSGALAGNAMRNPDVETRQLLARAVRPFILRRTKEQVVKELPAKTEQTIFCELDPVQRKHYNELLDYYRQSLLGKIDKQGMGKSKMMILEALLRLRQAACHPGLIDKERVNESSAKLETLLPQLEEVMEEGHKALVFSQFTSLLSIVRTNLDRNNVVYEYLDGSTKDREAHVDRFQNDPDCKLFLISLKAGGVGLNLTAADYVFLLDPWWNPAAESQAIDRTHRIGQQRPVFAYRLIAKDTVEEKVLELQKSKRELAESIISEDNRFVGNLKREDLELLFS